MKSSVNKPAIAGYLSRRGLRQALAHFTQGEARE